jgi:hypothetical protein
MSPDKNEKFLKWHQELKGNNHVVDFQTRDPELLPLR